LVFSKQNGMRRYLIILFFIPVKDLSAQIGYQDLFENKSFSWVSDSTSKELIFHYQSGSWTDKKISLVRKRLHNHLDSVKSFIGINNYDKVIFLFIVESREQMKLLVGNEANGAAFYQSNTITGIASSRINSIFSNHEMFHVISMNIWGVPDIWINEGMAVYSDNKWHSNDLYQLTKFLIDNNRYVSLKKLIKDFKKLDHLVSYPLAGSFTKYLDKTYGRETVINIWKGRTKNLKKYTGKTIKELESDWLLTIYKVTYNEIKY
jgi:hypothetical protein